jgi:hypothetical protein
VTISSKWREVRHAALRREVRNEYKQLYSENEKRKTPLGTLKYG